MPLRFTIRDLLWLTAVVAVLVAGGSIIGVRLFLGNAHRPGLRISRLWTRQRRTSEPTIAPASCPDHTIIDAPMTTHLLKMCRMKFWLANCWPPLHLQIVRRKLTFAGEAIGTVRRQLLVVHRS